MAYVLMALNCIVLFQRSRHPSKPIFVPCSQCFLSFLWKRGYFSRVCLSEGLSTDVASVSFAAPLQSVSLPFLASAPSTLESAVVRRTLNDSPVQVLVDSGASGNLIGLDVCAGLNLPVNGDRSSIGMASSEVSVETLGKTTADLKLLDQTYPSSNFRVLTNLCADVTVGQTSLKLHSSVTFVMNGHKNALTIAASSKLSNAGHTDFAAADLEPNM